MKKITLFLIAAYMLFSSSKCKDDVSATGNIEFNIKATFNSQPFVLNKIYDYNGKKVRFSKLTFFVSNINYPTNGPLITPQTILVDFQNIDDSTKSVNGLKVTANGLQAGNVTALNIGIGVSSIDNAKKPKDFASSNPLSDGGNYWDSWNSYIFTKFEGTIDKDGDGKFETGITLHTGGNEVYQTMTFNKNFTIDINSTTKLNFALNVNQLIDGIDLATVNSTHQTGDLPTMKIFTANFQKALTIQ